MAQIPEAGNMLDTSKQTLVITATFTAQPVEDALNYWMKELNFPFQVEFAPYNQVFQQLLDPASLLSRNEKGINIVLVRLEDWQRFEKTNQMEALDPSAKLERNTSELVQALHAAAARSVAPILVCLCPASPLATAD